MVLGHVLLGLYQSDRFTVSNDWLWFGVQAVYIFHIPVFFALSGYFFKPVASWSAYLPYVGQKTLQLGVPYLFYNVIQFILQQLGGNTVRDAASLADLFSIYRQPLGVSWFIYVLWGIFVVFGALSIVVKERWQLFAVSLGTLLLVSIFPTDLMIIQRVGLWASIFFLGSLLRERPVRAKAGLTAVLGCIIVAYLVLWAHLDFHNRISYFLPRYWGLIFFVVVPFAFMLYQKLPNNRLVTYFKSCGKDSLVIYLLHAQIVSVTRIVLLKVGVTNVFVHVLVGLALGWFGSLFALAVLKKVPYLDVVFYPQKYLTKSVK